MTTTVALNRQRSSPLWWMLKTGSRLAGAVIVAATIVTLWAYTGNWAWTRFVSPTAELIGVRAVQFAGQNQYVVIDPPVETAAVNPAKDPRPPLFDACKDKVPAGQEEIRLRECEEQLKSSVGKRS
jgi:hypothetical protein